jgi:hypothetical protein
MVTKAAAQYTIRNVPPSVDRALRKRAQAQGRSLNAILLEALASAASVAREPRTYRDLDHLIGSWVHDPETDRALDEQRRVEPGDWE